MYIGDITAFVVTWLLSFQVIPIAFVEDLKWGKFGFLSDLV
jgi:hypothetical protein